MDDEAHRFPAQLRSPQLEPVAAPGVRRQAETRASIFEKSVIPLLQEYFYEDYGKIQLVLGDNGKTGDNKQFQFIRDDKISVTDVFAGNPEVDIPENKYSIQEEAFRKIESYKLIGKGL